MLKVLCLCTLCFTAGISQNERWVYRYNGPGNDDDGAEDIVYGTEGHVYSGGWITSLSNYDDIAVVCFDTSGSLLWRYEYDGAGHWHDDVHSIALGADSNIYASGYAYGAGTDYDFIVLSVSSSGTQRWVYTYNSIMNLNDASTAVSYGADGNVYATGVCTSVNVDWDFLVLSLTPDGSQRWIYSYDGGGFDRGNKVIYGVDGNVYACGYIYGNTTGDDFAVISLTPDGSQRWIYQYNGPGNSLDNAWSIVSGADNNLYVAGYSTGSGSNYDFFVVSLDTAGAERWAYRYNGTGNNVDEAKSLIYGADGNIYIAGKSYENSTGYDITVVSLDTAGTQRWLCHYSGSGNNEDLAYKISYGADGNIYVAGGSYAVGQDKNFTVLCIDTSGTEHWVYQYNGPASSTDEAWSLVYGADGNIYASGYSFGVIEDFTVISINPALMIEEMKKMITDASLELRIHSPQHLQRGKIEYSLILGEPQKINLSVYDLVGERIASWQIDAVKGISHYDKCLANLSSGIYFLNAETGDKELRASRKFIIVK